MSNLISNMEMKRKLEQIIPSASEINIISAFITKPAYDWLFGLTQYTQPKINLVGRFSPKDFIEGASSIEAIRCCLLADYSVGLLSNLHAKIFQIDTQVIYTGSANMTGKGLALIEESNLEACTEVAFSEETNTFISKIVTSSITLTLEQLDKMQKLIVELVRLDESSIPDSWPEDIIPKVKEIFVSDFPFVMPGELCSLYTINPSLEFAMIEKNKADYAYCQSLFKTSKSYRWLRHTLEEHKGERDLGFGQVSQLLHAALSDDPAPYRRDIKDMQANLYKYVSLYAMDDIEIHIPGRRSEVLRLIK